MAVPSRVVHLRRATITALPLYYSGQLLKRNLGEKDYRSYFGELRGASLFLYNKDTEHTYTERLDLEQMKLKMLDSPGPRPTPTILTLCVDRSEVQLKLDNADTAEEWKCYILTMMTREIPCKMQLLPGQILLLKDALTQEHKRSQIEENPHPSSSPPPPLPPPRPAVIRPSPPPRAKTEPTKAHDQPDDGGPESLSCFYNVTRQEAQKMLEENPDNGHIIIRPSTVANNFVVTLRRPVESGHVIQNFRLTNTNSGYVIHLQKEVTVSTLKDALQYFLEKMEFRLHPYEPSQPYDTRLELSSYNSTLSLRSKVVPKAQVTPTMRPGTVEDLPPPLPPARNKLFRGEYVIPEDHSLHVGGHDPLYSVA